MPQHVQIRIQGSPPLSRLARVREFLRSMHLGPWNAKDKTLARYFSDGSRNAAGVVVNEATAFTFSAVFDAVNQISGDVAKLPLNLHKRNKDGGSDLYLDAKLYRLLKYEPNPEMGSMVFRRTLQAHALTCKGAFAEIERDALNRPVALWPLTPDRVEPFREESRDRSGRVRLGPIQYKVDGGPTVIPARDMLHIHGLGYDGHLAYSVIDKARQAIGLALAAERFGATFFGNGSTFGGLFTTDAELDEETEAKFRETIQSLHQGPDRAHKFLTLWGGTWKYSPLGVEPEKAQMDALRNKQVEEVARFFNMPLHKLKNLQRATNNNIEQQDLEYYKGCLLTWITLWEEELNRKLISPLESRQQYIKHNANAFLRGDIKSRYEALGIARDKGIINADEWRELEEMNPQPDGQGKLYLVPINMAPANRVNEIIDAQVAKAEQASTPTGEDALADVNAANDRAARAEAAQADRLTAALADSQTRIEHEIEARVLAESRAVAAETDAQELEAVRDRLTTDLQTAVEREQAAFQAMEAARAEAAEANGLVVASREDQARADAARADAEIHTREAIQALDQARSALADAEERADTSQVLAETARQEADRQIADLAAEYTAADAERARLQREYSDTATRCDEQAHAAAALEAQLADLTAAHASAEQALMAHRQAERTRLTNVIAAHRALIVDAMGRMIRRETDRVRKAQATPEKLRSWIATFYPVHEDIAVTALLPAVRTHLAWRQSDQDPTEVTRAIVRDHCAVSIRQLQTVLESDAADLGLSLETVMRQWESTRADALADQLLTEEIAYVREP